MGNTVDIMIQFPLALVAKLILIPKILFFIVLEDMLQARLGTLWHLL